MGAAEKSIDDLKEQLSDIQSEINQVESNSDPAKEVKPLFTWEAPARVFRKRDSRWFTNVAILVLVLIVILLFIREFIVISVVLAITFVYYVLATVPPQQVDHKISTQGITSAGHSYLWNEMVDFWFTSKYNQQVLNVSTKLRYPGRLIMLVEPGQEEKIKEKLVAYIPYREVPKIYWLDKMANWLSSRLPVSMR